MLFETVAKERPECAAFTIELIGASDLSRVREPWAALFDRSVECNVFFGPDFLQPLAEGLIGEAALQVLLAWRETAGRRTLAGFMPIHMPSAFFFPVRGATHHYIVGSAPLLHADCAVEAASALMDGLAGLRPGALLVLDDVRLDWPAWRAFVVAAERSGRVFEERDIVMRAGVSPRHDAPPVRGKVAQNLRRCAARLSKLGAWSVSTPDDPESARAGLEALLAVEASGWKGEQGTALASRPETLAFARQAFDPENRRPAPRFSVLALDGRPIAVSMHLIGHDHAANLKCAYDEEFAACSPGVLLDAAVADDVRRDAFTPMLDSVTAPGHPVERLWPERLRCGWVAVACDPAMSAATFRARLSLELLQRQTRERAATAYRLALRTFRTAFRRG
jgi:CelD/BcsL family acetyltransferase involved in cellulose biosynthesis